jgi:hypothetical protein
MSSEKPTNFLARWFLSCCSFGAGYALITMVVVGWPMILLGFTREDLQTLFILLTLAWGYYWASRE